MPTIISEKDEFKSAVSATFATNGYTPGHIFPIAVEEIRDGVRKIILHNTLPVRFENFYRMPLYVGRGAKTQKTFNEFDLY